MGPTAAFFAIALIWGSTFLFIRLGNEALPPLWGATLRLVIASAILAAIARAMRVPFPRGRALRAAAGFGFFQFGLNFSLLYWGQQRVPSGVASVLFALVPLTNALAARALGLERLTPAKIAGALIALVGVAILSGSQIVGRTDPPSLLAILLAVLFATLGSALLKLGPKQSPIGSNLAGSIVGIPVALALSVFAGEARALPITREALVPLLYLATLGSIGAFVLFAYLLNHWPMSRVGYISVCVPILALALGAIVRGERIAATGWIGTAVILAGLVIGLRAPSPPAESVGSGKAP